MRAGIHPSRPAFKREGDRLLLLAALLFSSRGPNSCLSLCLPQETPAGLQERRTTQTREHATLRHSPRSPPARTTHITGSSTGPIFLFLARARASAIKSPNHRFPLNCATATYKYPTAAPSTGAASFFATPSSDTLGTSHKPHDRTRQIS